MTTAIRATGARLETIAVCIETCACADRPRLRRRLRRLRDAAARGGARDHRVEALAADVEASRTEVARRRALVPPPAFPAALPISSRREEIAELIDTHPVVIVCGETGSGKSTQLPKICLGLGRGAAGRIGHTQPRRIAARSIAGRVAAELGVEPGGVVGWRTRFHHDVGRDTCLKVMTDGILLAELQSDPWLDQYDTLIIDEAHERSLNIDFLLGYLKRLLARRRDLRLVITSATIDPQRFASHFDEAPVVEVSGRMYPVEVRYRPPGDGGETEGADMQAAIVAAADEAAAAGPGDMLVFLPGEREIREAAEALRKHHPPHTEILPLYGRLSAAEQQRVFQPHAGRRIVLATNVAETSLTVPGIRYVIDTGLARISRYSPGRKIQRLPVEPVSRASADQRKGRCGRVAEGICIRLYGEEDYEARAPFTDPEILRTSLAGVILRMKDMGLGAVERFPFIDPPEGRQVRDGIRLLEELEALDARGGLTDTGRRLARLPVDPRIGRMLLAGAAGGCLAEMLVLAAALSVQDPRVTPHEAKAAARERHRAFDDGRSDFVTLLTIWHRYHEVAAHRSGRKLRKWCQENFLSWLRIREWRDVHGQLASLMNEQGARPAGEPAAFDAVHRALLAGLVGNVAQKQEGGDYLAVRGRRLAIHPGSALRKSGPPWIVCAELTETRRLYARTVAGVRPPWIEAAAAHQLRRQYLDPAWDPRQGRVTAREQVTLYGLVLRAKRRVDYGAVAPAEARQIFLREALVHGRMEPRPTFLARNLETAASLRDLEARLRRRDVLLDEQGLVALYERRLPAQVHDRAGLEKWLKRADADAREKLELSREELARELPGDLAASCPDTIELQGMRLPLRYRFEPGEEDDGITVQVPLAALNQLDAGHLEWLVPGWRRERTLALIRSLPKSLRRHFAPAPAFVDAFLARGFGPGDGALTAVLARVAAESFGIEIPADAWDERRVPDFLRQRIEVIDDEGRVAGASRDVDSLRRRLADRARAEADRAPAGAGGRRSWDFGELPETVRRTRHGIEVTAWPGLRDTGDAVDVVDYDTPADAAAGTRRGLRRLLLLALPEQRRFLARKLPGIDRMCLQFAPVGSCAELRADLADAIVDRAFGLDDNPVRGPAEFERVRDAGRGRVAEAARDVCALAGDVLERFHAIRRELDGEWPKARAQAREDLRSQLGHLVYPGFVSATPAERLPHLPRYLQAMQVRIERMRQAPGRDQERLAEVRPLWQGYLEHAAGERADDPELALYRWMLEEYRVSLFAQELGTAGRVSRKRLDRQWQRVTRPRAG